MRKLAPPNSPTPLPRRFPMFRRLVFENTAALFTLAAFLTATSIYLAVTWRALRMKRPQVERFAHLPFATATPPARHDATPARHS